VQLVRRLGYRSLVAALLFAVATVGHGLLMLGDLEIMHQGATGWFLMVLLWASLLFWLVLLLRWLGVSCFRAEGNIAASASQVTFAPPLAQSH
jgi:hypothetical protein